VSAVVQFDRVKKTYGQTVAVHDLSLVIHGGEAVAILGPNGAGKTTTIGMMLGLVHPTEGTVRLFGRNPTASTSHQRIGVVLQNVSVPDRLRVAECLNLFRGFYRQPLPLSELLDLAGLQEEQHTWAHTLSGGKMRRLQVALALAGNPDVLFLDEPTVGMDVSSKRHFWETMRGFLANGRTLILTTHDLHEADVMTDRVIVLHQGRVIADETPERIKMRVAGRRVQFVTDHPEIAQTLSTWPEVTAVRTEGRQVIAFTKDSDHTLRRLFERGSDIHDVLVSGGGLEDAFIELTQGSSQVVQPEGVPSS
jgi:ABC-2 type transport system ATP-binding protein